MIIDFSDPTILVFLGTTLVALLGNGLAMWRNLSVMSKELKLMHTTFSLKLTSLDDHVKTELKRVEDGFKSRNIRIDEDFKEDRDRIRRLEDFKDDVYKRWATKK